MAKSAFNKKKNHFINELDWHWRKKLVNCYIWSRTLYCIVLYCIVTGILRKLYQKYP